MWMTMYSCVTDLGRTCFQIFSEINYFNSSTQTGFLIVSDYDTGYKKNNKQKTAIETKMVKKF